MDVRTLRDSIAPTFHAILQASEHTAIKELNPFTAISEEMLKSLGEIDLGKVNMIYNALCNGGDTALITEELIPIMVAYMDACKLERFPVFKAEVKVGDVSADLAAAAEGLKVDSSELEQATRNKIATLQSDYELHMEDLDACVTELIEQKLNLRELEGKEIEGSDVVEKVLAYVADSSFYEYIGNFKGLKGRKEKQYMGFLTQDVVVRHSIPTLEVNDTYNFGRFLICIPIGKLGNSITKEIRAVPFTDSVYSNLYAHPHVGTEMQVCYGAEKYDVKSAAIEGDIGKILEITKNILMHYHDDNPYQCITKWKEYRDMQNIMESDVDTVSRTPIPFTDEVSSIVSKYQHLYKLNVSAGADHVAHFKSHFELIIPEHIREMFRKAGSEVVDTPPITYKLQSVPEFIALEGFVKSLPNGMTSEDDRAKIKELLEALHRRLDNQAYIYQGSDSRRPTIQYMRGWSDDRSEDAFTMSTFESLVKLRVRFGFHETEGTEGWTIRIHKAEGGSDYNQFGNNIELIDDIEAYYEAYSGIYSSVSNYNEWYAIKGLRIFRPSLERYVKKYNYVRSYRGCPILGSAYRDRTTWTIRERSDTGLNLRECVVIPPEGLDFTRVPIDFYRYLSNMDAQRFFYDFIRDNFVVDGKVQGFTKLDDKALSDMFKEYVTKRKEEEQAVTEVHFGSDEPRPYTCYYGVGIVEIADIAQKTADPDLLCFGVDRDGEVMLDMYRSPNDSQVREVSVTEDIYRHYTSLGARTYYGD